MSTDPWVWLAALLTLAIFSYLYRDNPVYKTAEYFFVGVASGYYLSIQFMNVIVPNLFQPVARGVTGVFTAAPTDVVDVVRILALVLGFLMFTRFVPSISWLSRWPIGLMVGAYSGLAVIGFAQGDLIEQIRSNLLPIVASGSWEALRTAQGFTALLMGVLWLGGNLVLITGLLATLYYFFFSSEHRGVPGKVARVGIYFLMISFGASYGFTVMSRISLALDRLRFLFSDWLGIHLLG